MSPAAILLAVLVAVSGTVHAQQASAEASDIARQVLQRQPWVAGTLACPAAAMPKPEVLQGVAKNKCTPGKRDVCLKKCTGGNASACYWLATELQADHADDNAADTLYLRACKRGISRAVPTAPLACFIAVPRIQQRKNARHKRFRLPALQPILGLAPCMRRSLPRERACRKMRIWRLRRWPNRASMVLAILPAATRANSRQRYSEPAPIPQKRGAHELVDGRQNLVDNQV